MSGELDWVESIILDKSRISTSTVSEPEPARPLIDLEYTSK